MFVAKIFEIILRFKKLLYSIFISSSKRVVCTAIVLYVGLLFVFAKVYLNNIDKGIDDFFDALYFSFVTMTTVGYGEITPTSDFSKGAVLVQVTSGLLLFGIIVSYIVKDHEEEILKKEKNYKKIREEEVFSKYYRKLIFISKSFERSIDVLMQCKNDDDFFNNLEFNALANIYKTSGTVEDGVIVSRIDNYIEKRNSFLKEIEFMAINFDTEIVKKREDEIFDHLAESEKVNFIPFLSNLNDFRVNPAPDVKEKLKGVDLDLPKGTLRQVAKHSKRPAGLAAGNFMTPFVNLYDDALRQKKLIQELKSDYKDIGN